MFFPPILSIQKTHSTEDTKQLFNNPAGFNITRYGSLQPKHATPKELTEWNFAVAQIATEES